MSCCHKLNKEPHQKYTQNYSVRDSNTLLNKGRVRLNRLNRQGLPILNLTRICEWQKRSPQQGKETSLRVWLNYIK